MKVAEEAQTRHAALMKSGVIPSDIKELCDPTKVWAFPFPSVHLAPTDRYPERDAVTFMGRELLEPLYDLIWSIICKDYKASNKFFVYGSVGIGKTYSLVALAAFLHCMLSRRRAASTPSATTAASTDPLLPMRVVYLPDCGAMQDQPVTYIRSALMFSYADAPSQQKLIAAIDTADALERFFET